ncbi:MAG: hypothetical protein ABL919_09645, partial [Methylococcales bacterium]
SIVCLIAYIESELYVIGITIISVDQTDSMYAIRQTIEHCLRNLNAMLIKLISFQQVPALALLTLTNFFALYRF